MSVHSSVAAQILIFFLMVFFLRRVCTGLVRSFRLPRPSSPALKFVEDLQKQVHGQAFTPGSAQGSTQGAYTPYSRARNEDAPFNPCEVAGPSLDGLEVISGTPLALPTPVGEVNDDADSPNLQPAKEALEDVLPTSRTTRMDVLGWTPESMHALIEEEFTNASYAEREGSTVPPYATTSLRHPDDPVTSMPCHNVILQPAPDTVDRPRRFRSIK